MKSPTDPFTFDPITSNGTSKHPLVTTEMAPPRQPGRPLQLGNLHRKDGDGEAGENGPLPSSVAIWIRGHDAPRLMGVVPSILSRWGFYKMLENEHFEPKSGGFVQMIFIFNWVIFRFHSMSISRGTRCTRWAPTSYK